jgi:hypothetical protein
MNDDFVDDAELCEASIAQEDAATAVTKYRVRDRDDEIQCR